MKIIEHTPYFNYNETKYDISFFSNKTVIGECYKIKLNYKTITLICCNKYKINHIPNQRRLELQGMEKLNKVFLYHNPEILNENTETSFSNYFSPSGLTSNWWYGVEILQPSKAEMRKIEIKRFL